MVVRIVEMKHVKPLAFASFSFHPPHLLFPLLLFSHSFVSDSLWHHGLHAAFQASLSFTMSQSLLRFMSLSQWCYLTISYSAVLFFCLQSFPASRSLPMSQLLASGGQNIDTSGSASVIPMNIQDWFHLGLTGRISLLSNEYPGLISFRIDGLDLLAVQIVVSPAPQFKGINSSVLILS